MSYLELLEATVHTTTSALMYAAYAAMLLYAVPRIYDAGVEIYGGVCVLKRLVKVCTVPDLALTDPCESDPSPPRVLKKPSVAALGRNVLDMGYCSLVASHNIDPNGRDGDLCVGVAVGNILQGIRLGYSTDPVTQNTIFSLSFNPALTLDS